MIAISLSIIQSDNIVLINGKPFDFKSKKIPFDKTTIIEDRSSDHIEIILPTRKEISAEIISATLDQLSDVQKSFIDQLLIKQ